MAGILSWLGIGKDIKDVADGIGDNTTKIINAAKGQLPPEQQVQIAELETNLKSQIETLKSKAEEGLQQFILNYEGRADQVPTWLLVWRSVIRPALTTFFFLQLAAVMVVDGYNLIVHQVAFDSMLLTNLPTPWWVIMGIVVSFWFGGRAGEKIVDAVKHK